MRATILKKKATTRKKRKLRVRGKISGTAELPRVSVFKSNRYFYAQAIDDINGNTLASADGKKLGVKSNIDGAKVVGEALAEALKTANLESVVFDRNGYQYHGVVKSFADSLRANGIKV